MQHGFIPGKSCVTQLVEVIDYIGSLLDSGKQTDVIYLDMSKAFDKVQHSPVLGKLRIRQYNICGNLLSWFTFADVDNETQVPQVPHCGHRFFRTLSHVVQRGLTKNNRVCFRGEANIKTTVGIVNDIGLQWVAPEYELTADDLKDVNCVEVIKENSKTMDAGKERVVILSVLPFPRQNNKIFNQLTFFLDYPGIN